MPTEAQEQTAVVQWLRNHGRLVFSVPNEARRSPGLAKHMQHLGMLAGMTDLVIVQPTPIGLEMKRIGGKVTPRQLAVHEALRQNGWHVVVGYGAKDAIAKLEKILA